MKKVSVIAAAVSSVLLSASVSAVDFHGYARAGVGLSGDNGENYSYEKKKVGRLGNENDLYAEMKLTQEVYNNNGVQFELGSLVAYAADGNNNWESQQPAFREMYVNAKGLFEDEGAVLWAGQKYYQRKDIHITDFYFLDTSGGAGAGIENLTLGGGKFSLAVMHDDGTQNGSEDVSGYTLDARYAGIELWDKANLELALAYDYGHEKDGQTIEADDGVLLTAVIGQGLSTGFNQTVLQFGTESYGHQMGTYGGGGWYDRSGDNNGATGFRVINWGVVGLGDSWELGHTVMFASAEDTKDGDITAMNAVVRPVYKWDENMKTIFEAGYYTEEKNDVDGAGSKLTVAQAWGAGSSFWARPEIRVYASYLSDYENDTAFGNSDSEMSVGVQMEAWW